MLAQVGALGGVSREEAGRRSCRRRCDAPRSDAARDRGEPAHQYVLIDTIGQRSVADLRVIQDRTLRFELEAVPGVSEVATVGGYEKRYRIVLDPERLRSPG